MKTAITILGVFFAIGVLVAVGTLFFNIRSFSSSLPRGEGGLLILDGSTSLTASGENFKNISSTAGLEAKSFIVSKINSKVMYLGSLGNGIWVSKDGGKNFKKAQDKILQGRVDVYDIKEDNKGNLYLSIYKDNRGSFVFSSFDKGSSEIYFNSLPKFGIFGSFLDGGTISIIASDGGFYRSINNGKSWELRSRKNEGLLAMYSVSGKSYVLTSEGKILLTTDSGKSWKDITPFAGKRKYKIRDFYMDARSGSLIAVSDKLLRSLNGGDNWQEINLIVPADALPIISSSIHPANSNIIFAASENILYKSVDGGSSWSFQEVPTNRKISKLFVSSATSSLLFLSTK